MLYSSVVPDLDPYCLQRFRNNPDSFHPLGKEIKPLFKHLVVREALNLA